MNAKSEAVIVERIAPALMSPGAASEYLGGIPEGTLAVWRSTGRVRLPFVKIGGHVRYRKQDLDAFIESHLRGAGIGDA